MTYEATKRFVRLKTVPPRIVSLTAAASYASLVFAAAQNWPLWARVVAVGVPWGPLLTREIGWAYRHYGWLAIFWALVLTQTGHFLEHVVQIYQIHILKMNPKHAHGVFGALDIEWVHFLWNSWVVVAAGALLLKFKRNALLWVTFGIAAWHSFEHLVIFARYLATGENGWPGLIASGGLIGGGLPISRPNLHFAYNLIETIPLVGAFVVQVGRTHDSWIERALPDFEVPLWTELTNRFRIRRYEPGEILVREGVEPSRFFVISDGSARATREVDGAPLLVGELGEGHWFGETGLLSDELRGATVTATTRLEVLEIGVDEFRNLLDRSGAVHNDF